MLDPSDAQLLRDYAEQGNEAAFREIVTRHAGLVYSAALRQVDSADLAGDVAQNVFVDLARKARPLASQLAEGASLVGWLYRSTRFASLNQLRRDRRRLRHEREAMEQLLTNSETSPDWERIRPVLDDAMASLDEEDRDALLLRFFKKQDLRAVGSALGVGDDAAQKRVSRAVERLREFFAKRGVTIGASGLVLAITANAVQAAPAGLVAAISAAAGLAGTTVAAAATATQAIAMTTLQKTLLTATLAVAVGAGIYEARQASSLRNQVQVLQQKHAPLAEQIEQLTRERNETTRRFAALLDDEERLNRNTPELLKLRAEVTRLRSLQNQSAAQRGVSSSELPEWKPDQLMNAGRSTPQNAAQTFFWAEATTNLIEMADSIVPDASDPPSDEAIQDFVKSPTRHKISELLKLRVLSQTNISGDEVQLELYAQSAQDLGVSRAITLRNVEGQWKFVLYNTRDADGRIHYVDLGKKHSLP